MKGRVSILILFYVLMCSMSVYAADSGVLPQPAKETKGKGALNFYYKVQVITRDKQYEPCAEYLIEETKRRFHFTLGFEKSKNYEHILMKHNPALEKDAYRLTVIDGQAICEASGPSGMFYAIQTLLQSVKKKLGKYVIPAMTIEDSPRYSWRGMMLDVSRHFHDKETIKEVLDMMATLKMNRFHWHLTDEDGWRIEIKKYPALTQVGAIGNWSNRNAMAKYFTQEEVKEIVAYAQERHITIIPEIDMPGHASAASRAYPELSAGGEGRWAGFTFHPAKESTYSFIDDVLTELVELFPGPYIHIGGDEVHFGNEIWSTDPAIQQFIKEQELGDIKGLEHYFVRRVVDIVKEKGKTVMGWDEIIDSGISPEQTVVMWWRHDKPEQLQKALSKGFKVVMTPRLPCYFDFVQHSSQQIGRRWEGKFNTLANVYEFPKSVAPLIAKNPGQVMGMQASVWTERIADKERLYYMLFPRLIAMAEAAWGQESAKNYKIFLKKLKVFLPYLDERNINYFNPFEKVPLPEPVGPTEHALLKP